MYGPFGAIERAGCLDGECLRDSVQIVELNSINSICGNFSGCPDNEPYPNAKQWRPNFVRSEASGVRKTKFLATLLRPLVWINDRAESQLRAWRWGRPVQTFSLFSILIAHAVLASAATAADPVVRFDVPSLVEASVATDTHASGGDLKEIQVLIPVTTEIRTADRDHVNEFRYDISWQHADYPIVDFGPRTRTTSKIDGTIGVETRKDHNATLDLGLNGGELGVVGGSAKAEVGKHDEKKIHYNEIPQHDVLVASGTVERGTGAFFRFHRSRRETLEGSRELSVSFRVPSDWQAGLLRVKCHARGERKVASFWSEPIENIRSFTLPVYLASSSEARDRAVEYVRAERGVQQLVARRQSVEQAAKPTGVESVFRGLLGLSNNKMPNNKTTPSNTTRTDNGTRREPQSRVVRYRVPMSTPDVSGRYKHARDQLLQLSR